VVSSDCYGTDCMPLCCTLFQVCCRIYFIFIEGLYLLKEVLYTRRIKVRVAAIFICQFKCLENHPASHTLGRDEDSRRELKLMDKNIIDRRYSYS